MKALKRLAVGLASALCCAHAVAASTAGGDPILARNSFVVVHKSELDVELERVPQNTRDEFLASPNRIGELLAQMLVRKTLASQARAHKLDEDPLNAERMRIENERMLAHFRMAGIDKQAAAEFDGKLAQQEDRARELYRVDREKYRTPEQVNASHILLHTKKRSSEDARRLVEEARARVIAGADFERVAREVSEDASVAVNGGALGWFTRERMDPAFATAAFALTKVGTISEPVLSQFGWHIIRLEGRRESRVRPFDEVRDQIIGELRTRYIEMQRDATVTPIRNDPGTTINKEALEQIIGKARAGREAAAKRPASDGAVKP
jgi:peptidyl-prolyl cis-trans isomerase C